eukprot:3243022-Amphidinium_carterae.1
MKHSSSRALIWNQQFGSNGVNGESIAVSGSGDVYVAGSTSIALDDQALGGSSDAFIMKLSSAGVWAWTRQVGTEEADVAHAVAVGPSGNIYVAGETLGALGTTNAGDYDIFLASLDPDGATNWIVQRGTSSVDRANAVAVGVDAIYITGLSEGAMDGETHYGDSDVVTLKFSLDGTWQWTRQRGSNVADYGNAIA